MEFMLWSILVGAVIGFVPTYSVRQYMALLAGMRHLVTETLTNSSCVGGIAPLSPPPFKHPVRWCLYNKGEFVASGFSWDRRRAIERINRIRDLLQVCEPSVLVA